MRLPTNVPRLKDDTEDNNDVKELEEDIELEVDMGDLPEDMVKIPDKEEKFNKYIEKIIRSSYEYNKWIGILTNEMDLTTSKMIPAVTSTEKGLSIEMHHYPFSLYDIVSGYRLMLQEAGEAYLSYQPFKVAKQVMKLHYQGYVSVVPLDLTSHELYHSGQLFIPLTKDYVFGDWQKMIDKHLIELTPDIKDNLKNLKDSTTRFITDGKNEGNDFILQQKKLKIVDLSGVESAKVIED